VTAQRSFVVAFVLDVLGAAGALVLSFRPWQTITLDRPAPLHGVVLDVKGRTVDGSPAALALVALAGVVALLATKGFARRIVGGVLVVTGIVLAWRAIAAAGRIGTGRARTLLADARRSVDVSGAAPQVATHPGWAIATVVCAGLVLAAGLLAVWFGPTWQAMSRRYEAPATTSDAALWNVLDRGEDPTA
jgi:uncharacterized membrane protein (TIGR02234 family)